MLRKVFIKNFVLFKEEYRLDFPDNSHFVIGANNTGKSSLFESIRRCLSTSMSTSLSSAFDKDQISLVCAHFKTGSEQKDIVSAIIGFPNPGNKTLYIKMVNKISGTKESREMDLVKENLMGNVVNEEYEVKNKTCYNFLKSFVNQDIDSTGFIAEVNKILKPGEEEEFLKKDVAVTEDTKCNSILKELDDQVVNTFPNRGIGPLQWSQSKLVHASAKIKNYEYAQDMAEIIKWFEEGKQLFSRDELKREDEYYNIITDNSGLQFKLNDGKLTCKKFETNGVSGKEVYLLKVPEGYLEAKHCSILLAVDCFKTVILEDPEKGMHPQMIERLRDLVFPRVKGKLVLVSSHHPHFLSSRNINKVFLLRPSQNPLKRESKIISVKCILDNFDDPGGAACSQNKEQICHRLSTPDFRSILYAERVIIVEGKWDVMFVESVKHLLLADENDESRKIHLSKFVDGPNDEKKIREIKSKLATLVIHPAAGIGNIDILVELCYKLQIYVCSLKDNDPSKYKGKSNSNKKTTKKGGKGKRHKKTKTTPIGKRPSDLETYKGQLGFMWKKGNLENTFVNFNSWLSDKEFQKKLKKVLNFGKVYIGKFGKIGTVNDRYDAVRHVLKKSEENIRDDDGKDFRCFIKFLFEFLLQDLRKPVKT